MMRDLSHRQKTIAFLAAVTVLALCIFYYLSETARSLGITIIPSQIASIINNDQSQSEASLGTSTSSYPPSILDYDYGLRNLCDNTAWTPGLWIHCHSKCGASTKAMCGGLNNARNRLQTCIRLAIDAGAGLIVATTVTRDPHDLLNPNVGEVCAETLFDIDNMQDKLRSQCPQLNLRFCGNVTGIQTAIVPPQRKWEDRPPFIKGNFREFLMNHTSSDVYAVNMSLVSTANSLIIEYGDSFIAWDYRESLETIEIRKDLFKLIDYNKKLSDTGLQVLESPTLQGNPNGYIGIHLRGENDWPASLGSLDHQVNMYEDQLKQLAIGYPYLRVVYVSCGSRSAVDMLRERIAGLGFTVYTKEDILATQGGELAAQVDSMFFDEKAVVEYQALVNANHFLGLWTSSFSAIVAYARTVDDEGSYYDDFIYPGSETPNRRFRTWPNASVVGNENTRLIVLPAWDIYDSFP